MFPPLTPRFVLLGSDFVSRVTASPLPSPHLVAWNQTLADELGLAAAAAYCDVLAGNQALEDYPSFAALYAGHQFGVFVPQLGDGRAITIAEIDSPQGVRELQLKGSGMTPYSRHADGRAVLRSTIREYLCSEAMHGLGIPTTRALAIVGSPEAVYRETVESAAVLTRVAESHIRFGSFEVFFYRNQYQQLRTLADYVIDHFYPQCRASDNPYQALLEAVIARTAALMAQWQLVGFCHGVMNTDNMSILGLTLDYGPFGFLDAYDPAHICNRSDHQGRYAYNQQPDIGHWNLYCLAQALIPLLDKDAAVAALESYPQQFGHHAAAGFAAKLGLTSWNEGDGALLQRLLDLMAAGGTDWTRFWRALASFDSATAAHNEVLRNEIVDRAAFDAWAVDYAARLQAEHSIDAERAERMRRTNPKYVLRNHLAETAIRLARDDSDFSEITRLQRCLAHPFDEQPEFEAYAALPPDWAAHLSVSCSS